MMVLLLVRLEEERAHIMVESNHGFTMAGEVLDQQRIRLQVIHLLKNLKHPCLVLKHNSCIPNLIKSPIRAEFCLNQFA
jgi:hypothetical protein